MVERRSAAGRREDAETRDIPESGGADGRVSPMLDHVFRKLTRFADLAPGDRERIEACAWRVDRVEAGVDLIGEGADPGFVNVTLDGWACRYKQWEDGRRQILALLLPGDMCDPCMFLLNDKSHALATLTRAKIVRLPQKSMAALMEASPTLTRAFWLDMLVSVEVQREWTVSLGRRTAVERMAHLFCELLVRLRSVGLADASGCEMPLTQYDLGDALGLSSVHVNRTLQKLRSLKLIELRNKRLDVLDKDALRTLALFNPMYLHLQR